MNNRRSDLLFAGTVVLVILALIGLTWVNYSYSLKNPTGNDFLPRWLGTRLFLMEGQSPYSEETSSSIQIKYQQKYGTANKLDIQFIYPFFSIFIFAPFALITNFDIALAVWMTALEVSIISIALVSISLSDWRLRPIGIIALLVFIALWYHSIRPLIVGNTTIIVVTFICAAIIAIRAEHDGLAGFLLAMSMIQPQLVLLLIIMILVWSVSNRRWALFWSFIGSLALLIASTSLLIPSWTRQDFRQVFIYINNTLPVTPGTILAAWVPGVGKQIGWALTIFMIISLLWEWRLALDKDFRWFLWTACLTLTITQLIGLRTSIDNYIILVPGIVLVLATWYERWGKLGRWLVFFGVFMMLFGLWVLVIDAVREGVQLELNPVVFFFAPVSVLIGLYWVRWWVINPMRFSSGVLLMKSKNLD